MDYSEIVELQEKWCNSGTDAIRNGAREAVDLCSVSLGAKGIPYGEVAEVGPQWGFGLERWRQLGVPAFGIDIVPSFIQSCRDKGFECYECPAEGIDLLDELKDAKVNWYLRDTLEHFYDRQGAIENILDRLDKWIYLSVPIEPGPGRDEAHLGRIKSYDEVHEMLPELTCIHEKYRPPGQKQGRLEGIWIKD